MCFESSSTTTASRSFCAQSVNAFKELNHSSDPPVIQLISFLEADNKTLPNMMYKLLLCSLTLVAISDARIQIRHRRSIEREGPAASSSDSDNPNSQFVVIKDVNPQPQSPFFLIPRQPADAFDLDIDEKDGTFAFGGRLPSMTGLHSHHQSFASLFEAIQKRFDGKLSLSDACILSLIDCFNTHRNGSRDDVVP